MLNASGRALLPGVELSPAGRRAVEVGLRQIERLSTEIKMLGEEICEWAQAELGCRALVEAHYGVGPMLAFAIWAEMGDPRRFSSSSDAVRYAGIDITVYSSDGKRSRGHLPRQGPSLLRWALYEAAVHASRPSSPDHRYYEAVKARHQGDAQIAILSEGALLAAREFESATVKELMLSPAPRWAVCLGKVLAALAVNSMSAVVVLAVVTALVGGWPRYPGELAVFAGLMMLGSAGLGVLVGSLLRRVAAAIPLAIATSLPLFFLSGPFGPPNWLGAVTGALAHLSPAYYGIGALQHAFHGYQTSQSSLSTDAAVLALIAAAGVVGSSRLLSARGIGR